MKVLSVNISALSTLEFEGKHVETGYFKKAVASVYLSSTGVKQDAVADREHHGGPDKACYLFGYNHYPFWRQKYPMVSDDFGLFGENITISNLDESQLRIGDVLKVGAAKIQITQPRQPCFKMGLKFKDQNIVKEFRMADTPGIYVRVLEEGEVMPNDHLQILESDAQAPSVLETFRLIYSQNPEPEQVYTLLQNSFLAEKLKLYIKNKFTLS